MMRRRGGALALLLILSCGDSGQPSGAGDLLVAYHAGSPDAGAIVLTISGGPVETVTAVGNQQVSFSTPFETTTRVVVIGDLATGDLLRIRVPDVSQGASYTARAEQVADKSTFALIATAEHTFTIHQ